METLTWTGPLGTFLNPLVGIITILLAITIIMQIFSTMIFPTARGFNPDGSLQVHPTTHLINLAVKYCFYVFILLMALYLIMGSLFGTSALGIIGGISRQLLPIWISMIAIFSASIIFKTRLGLYGKLFDSPIGMIGFALVLFWVLVTILGGGLDLIVTHDELSQVSGMKNKLPGTPMRGATESEYAHYLLGGDNLARDVFSRVIKGSAIVIVIAPAATLFAFMVGITLGLPAGYYETPLLQLKTKSFYTACGVAVLFSLLMFTMAPIDIAILITILSILVIWMLLKSAVDTVISFIANLILAFPVIL
ncbi:MAG: ABC transporter permease, partial [Planktomarina sp.]|nr:ABC transporter permease [Planktomarina sp.]